MIEYKIKVKIPVIDYESYYGVIRFEVIKVPVLKYTNIVLLYLLLDSGRANKLISDHVSKKRNSKYIDLIMNIYTSSSNIKCDDIDADDDFKYVVIKNKHFLIGHCEILNTTAEKHSVSLVRLLLFDKILPKLLADRSLSKQYSNVSPKVISKRIINLVKSLGAGIYDRLKYNDYKYKTLWLNQDDNPLEHLYNLCINYKLSVDIPIVYYDNLTSNDLFDVQTTNVLKLYNINSDINNKHDVSAEIMSSNLLKTYTLSNKYIDNILQPVSKVILTDDSGNTNIVNLNEQIISSNINSSLKNKTVIEQSTTILNSSNLILRIDVPDNNKHAIHRFVNVRNFLNNIDSIKRISIESANFKLFDIGIMYKITDENKYNSAFLNIAYVFKLADKMNMTFKCNVIGDLLVF